jgi:hypothetical protein
MSTNTNGQTNEIEFVDPDADEVELAKLLEGMGFTVDGDVGDVPFVRVTPAEAAEAAEAAKAAKAAEAAEAATAEVAAKAAEAAKATAEATAKAAAWYYDKDGEDVWGAPMDSTLWKRLKDGY